MPPHTPPSSAFRAISEARLRVAHSPPRILVAEDDTEMRRLVSDALRKDGYHVTEASDGGRLLVQVTSLYPRPDAELDLLISDIRMPVVSGLAILESLRRAHWKVPVILMTAFGDDETRAQAVALGAILFDKPFAIDDLRTAVLNVLPYARS
jgi:DNA-binding response OmpR family regulator